VKVGVAVGGTGVAVKVGVAVGGTGVAVKVGVAVGGTGVAVNVGVAVGPGWQFSAHSTASSHNAQPAAVKSVP
jgi:hypothetical protein